MKLLFQASNGNERLVAEVTSENEAMKKINDFCEERDYKIPYVRSWGSLDDEGITYDVGSHTEFFYLVR